MKHIIYIVADMLQVAVSAGREDGAILYYSSIIALALLYCHQLVVIRNLKRQITSVSNKIRNGTESNPVQTNGYGRESTFQKSPNPYRLQESGLDYSNCRARLSHQEEFQRKARRAVIRNAGDTKYNINRLCADMNMERTTFYRAVRRYCDMMPTQYLNYLRVEYAMEIMARNSELNYNQIAGMVGFIDANGLIKQMSVYKDRITSGQDANAPKSGSADTDSAEDVRNIQ